MFGGSFRLGVEDMWFLCESLRLWADDGGSYVSVLLSWRLRIGGWFCDSFRSEVEDMEAVKWQFLVRG